MEITVKIRLWRIRLHHEMQGHLSDSIYMKCHYSEYDGMLKMSKLHYYMKSNYTNSKLNYKRTVLNNF